MDEGWGTGSLEQTFYERCNRGSDIVDHLPRLYLEASRPGVHVLELGVRSGNSTSAFLAAADQHGGHVTSVDISTPTVPADWWGCGRWTFIKGDDLKLGDRLAGPYDIVFIDTSHHYLHTLEELVMADGLLADDGCIILHDTELRSPENCPPTDPPYPVREAIITFLERSPEWAVDWVEGCNGLAVMRRQGLTLAAA